MDSTDVYYLDYKVPHMHIWRGTKEKMCWIFNGSQDEYQLGTSAGCNATIHVPRHLLRHQPKVSGRTIYLEFYTTEKCEVMATRFLKDVEVREGTSIFNEKVEVEIEKRSFEDCPDCRGTREYKGLNVIEVCGTCKDW